MPEIKVLKTQTNRLEKNTNYRMIIRKNGIAFRKANTDDPLDTLLILTLTTQQLIHVQLIEKNNGKETYISLEAEVPEGYQKTSKTTIEFKSTELPDKTLYNKLVKIIHPGATTSNATTEKETTGEEGQDEEVERDPLLTFFDALTAAFMNPIIKISMAGIALLKSGVTSVQNTIKAGLKTINKITSPIRPA